MKKVKPILFSILAVALVSVSCKDKASDKGVNSNAESAASENADPKNFPVMYFEKMEHDFGTIVQGTPQETTFTFTNTGKVPLLITDAKTSCGCTIPEYPKDTPIEPGQSGELLVKYNGNGKNQVTKSITLTTNTMQGKEILRIKAFVNAKEEMQKADIINKNK